MRDKRRKSFLQAVVAMWDRVAHAHKFVKCPCPTCGGMVSVRECMVEGKSHWFCTVSSRDLFESGYFEPIEIARVA
jgi:hypothetical protein